MEKWTTEFPTEKGKYWFYGYRYGKVSCGVPREPECMIVKVAKSSSGHNMYIAEGSFMYQSEVEEPHFKPFEYPEFPKLKDDEA